MSRIYSGVSRQIWEKLISFESLVYCVAVILTSIAGFVFCSMRVALSEQFAIKILEILIVVTTFAWLALSNVILEKNFKLFFLSFTHIFLISVPIVCLFLQVTVSYQVPFFWLSLVLWSAMGINATIAQADRPFDWNNILLAIGVILTISSVIISVGRIPFLNYAEFATNQLIEISIWLDFRLILSTLFVSLILITALVKAINDQYPSIPGLKTVQLPEPKRGNFIYLSFLAPFLILSNFFLLVLSALADIIWRTFKIIMIYFIKVGHHIVGTVIDLVAERDYWILIGKLLGRFFWTIILSIISIKLAVPIYKYLQSSLWIQQIQNLILAIGLTTVLSLCVFFILFLTKGIFNELLEPSGFSLASILSVLMIAGLILHGISFIESVTLKGFQVFGPFLVALLLLILSGIAKLIIDNWMQ